jgi:pyruvate/2-oxoglutarate dehydrogenase complex dihydrolipoamide acyltransferase (E2) component
MPDVILPRFADTLVEGTVSRWLKRAGEHVARGEPLVEVETDKVNSELESPYEGVLTEIVASEGTTVPVGEVIARIEEAR